MDTKDKDFNFDDIPSREHQVYMTKEEQDEFHRQVALSIKTMKENGTLEDPSCSYICSDYFFGDSNKLYEENERIINKILNRKPKE